MNQSSERRCADSGEELNRFHRLHRSNHSREHAQDTSFGSCRDGSFGWYLWQETTIARTSEVGSEDRYLSLELKNGGVDQRLLEKVGRVICGKASGEVIGTIEDGIVWGDQFERVFSGETTGMKNHLDVRVGSFELVPRALQFRGAHSIRAVKDLTVEV